MIRMCLPRAISLGSMCILMRTGSQSPVQGFIMIIACRHSKVIGVGRPVRGVCTVITESWEVAVLKILITHWSRLATICLCQVIFFKLILLVRSMKEDQLRGILFRLIDQETLILINSLQTMKELTLLRVISLLWTISSTELASALLIPIFTLQMEPLPKEDAIQVISMLSAALAIIIRNSRCSKQTSTKTQ